MSPLGKFTLGLAAVAGMTWIHQGPLGNGEAFIRNIEAQAQKAVKEAEVPGVAVQLGHNPLSRRATLSGPADSFQREGQGELKGLNDRVHDIPGISGLRWTDQPDRFVIPFLAEILALTILAYLAGLALSWLFWGRARHDDY